MTKSDQYESILQLAEKQKERRKERKKGFLISIL